MMKYIVFWTDPNGKQVNFERFNTGLKATQEAAVQLAKHPIYKATTPGAVCLKVYATPDGYHHETTPAATYDMIRDCWI